MPLALDPNLALPDSYNYSPPPLDDQIIDEFYDDMQSWHEYPFLVPLHHDSPIPCVDVPFTSKALIAALNVPYIDKPLTYVHDYSSSEPLNLEVDMSLIEESQVNALSVSSVESYYTSLRHCDLLPTTLPHTQFDARDDFLQLFIS